MNRRFLKNIIIHAVKTSLPGYFTLNLAICHKGNIHQLTVNFRFLFHQICQIFITVHSLTIVDKSTKFTLLYILWFHRLTNIKQAASLVHEGNLDLALVNMNFYNIDKLNSYRILTDKIVFCVTKDHPLAKEKEVSIEMLKNEPVILYNTDSVHNATLYDLSLSPNATNYNPDLY